MIIYNNILQIILNSPPSELTMPVNRVRRTANTT